VNGIFSLSPIVDNTLQIVSKISNKDVPCKCHLTGPIGLHQNASKNKANAQWGAHWLNAKMPPRHSLLSKKRECRRAIGHLLPLAAASASASIPSLRTSREMEQIMETNSNAFPNQRTDPYIDRKQFRTSSGKKQIMETKE
jgi:hypothetical protein